MPLLSGMERFSYDRGVPSEQDWTVESATVVSSGLHADLVRGDETARYEAGRLVEWSEQRAARIFTRQVVEAIAAGASLADGKPVAWYGPDDWSRVARGDVFESAERSKEVAIVWVPVGQLSIGQLAGWLERWSGWQVYFFLRGREALFLLDRTGEYKWDLRDLKLIFDEQESASVLSAGGFQYGADLLACGARFVGFEGEFAFRGGNNVVLFARNLAQPAYMPVLMWLIQQRREGTDWIEELFDGQRTALGRVFLHNMAASYRDHTRSELLQIGERASVTGSPQRRQVIAFLDSLLADPSFYASQYGDEAVQRAAAPSALGMHSLASERLEELIEGGRDTFEARVALGREFEDLRNIKAALDNYRRALGLQPDDEGVKKRIRRLEDQLLGRDRALPGGASR